MKENSSSVLKPYLHLFRIIKFKEKLLALSIN